MKKESKLLVIIPHAGTKRPKEIKKSRLSKHNERMLFSEDCETDRGTEKLYDFTKILGNKQIKFPISQIYVNVCRDHKRIDEAVPLLIRAVPVYKKSKEIPTEIRKVLLKEYYFPFYENIRKEKKRVIFNGHSFVPSHESLGKEKVHEDIVLTDWLELDGRVTKFAPKRLLDIYASEIKKRLPGIKIGRNSVYLSSYDYICATFGSASPNKSKVPIIHQETNEILYITGNKIDNQRLNKLRKVFAESLSIAINKYFS